MSELTQPSEASSTTQSMLGNRSEQKAARHLKSKGYRILTRNYSCIQGEIDIIAFLPQGAIIFTEVRSKTEPVGVDPLKTIDTPKRKRLVKAAYHYINYHNLKHYPISFRFDVISLRYNQDASLKKMEHVENAFEIPEI